MGADGTAHVLGLGELQAGAVSCEGYDSTVRADEGHDDEPVRARGAYSCTLTELWMG